MLLETALLQLSLYIYMYVYIFFSFRFYLIFGICVEALCGQRSLDDLDQAKTCLEALYTLLDTAWARNILMTDRSLPIELCNVLHRLIITTHKFEPQYLCLKILKLITTAAREHLEHLKKMKLKGVYVKRYA